MCTPQRGMLSKQLVCQTGTANKYNGLAEAENAYGSPDTGAHT